MIIGSILNINNSFKTVELNSLSKMFNMAGWRVECISSKEHIDNILKIKSNMIPEYFMGSSWCNQCSKSNKIGFII